MNRRGLSDEWLTPLPIVNAVGGAASFDLDPATPLVQPYPTARRRYHKADDGLFLPWFGRVWLNPPYSRPLISRFLARMALHNRGIAFIFARTDTVDWRDHVWNAASGLLFVFQRVDFNKPDGSSVGNDGGAPSVLCAYGRQDLDVLAGCGIAGKFVPLILPRGVLVMAVSQSWQDVVAGFFATQPRGPVSIDALYRALADHPKARDNRHVRAKLRQTLQRGPFRRVAPGEWVAA